MWVADRRTLYGWKLLSLQFLLVQPYYCTGLCSAELGCCLTPVPRTPASRHLQKMFHVRDSPFPRWEVHHSRLQQQHNTEPMTSSRSRSGDAWVWIQELRLQVQCSLHRSMLPHLMSCLRYLLDLKPFNHSKRKNHAPTSLSGASKERHTPSKPLSGEFKDPSTNSVCTLLLPRPLSTFD